MPTGLLLALVFVITGVAGQRNSTSMTTAPPRTQEDVPLRSEEDICALPVGSLFIREATGSVLGNQTMRYVPCQSDAKARMNERCYDCSCRERRAAMTSDDGLMVWNVCIGGASACIPPLARSQRDCAAKNTTNRRPGVVHAPTYENEGDEMPTARPPVQPTTRPSGTPSTQEQDQLAASGGISGHTDSNAMVIGGCAVGAMACLAVVVISRRDRKPADELGTPTDHSVHAYEDRDTSKAKTTFDADNRLFASALEAPAAPEGRVTDSRPPQPSHCARSVSSASGVSSLFQSALSSPNSRSTTGSHCSSVSSSHTNRSALSNDSHMSTNSSIFSTHSGHKGNDSFLSHGSRKSNDSFLSRTSDDYRQSDEDMRASNDSTNSNDELDSIGTTGAASSDFTFSVASIDPFELDTSKSGSAFDFYDRESAGSVTCDDEEEDTNERLTGSVLSYQVEISPQRKMSVEL